VEVIVLLTFAVYVVPFSVGKSNLLLLVGIPLVVLEQWHHKNFFS